MANAAKSISKPEDRIESRLSVFSPEEWRRAVDLVLLSRALDDIEEQKLVPEKKILYQFSARGHDVTQVLLGLKLQHKRDAFCGYYRSRPLVLAVGADAADAVASCMARAGGYSGGRDIGAVFNFPNADGCSGLPMCGGVGAQYTPAVGWAQAVKYRAETLRENIYDGAIAVAHGGEASVATNGFWSALTIATTQRLPMLFYIEDNGYGISVPSIFQTPGANIAKNLASFENLAIYDGNGGAPGEAAALIDAAVTQIRAGVGPALVRLTVPRLSGHSAQDTQTYKSDEKVADEISRDPLPALRELLVPALMTDADWRTAEARAAKVAESAVEEALSRPEPSAEGVARHVFFEGADDPESIQTMGGLAAEAVSAPAGSPEAMPSGARINMVTAIRRVLDHELSVNDRMLVFGEDIGPKGGVHAVTMGLQEKHGFERVFDTSLSEEGIIGRAVGMAMAGLMPAPEIQFRKYADPACEQLNDCGTMRWRTNNRFAAPMVVRMPIGFFKCGDPWHSQTNEVQFVHSVGWKVAVPSNAEDAVGLLRAGLRGNDPVIFFEHRAMLDAPWARRKYPGDDYILPFGKATLTREGDDITLVTWGAMVERCEQAAEKVGAAADVIDLRTLAPWDADSVLRSVAKTHRCLIVHEDTLTAGFGAEIAARVASDAFMELDAPVERLTMPDIPSPHSPLLLNAVVPSVDVIADKIRELTEF